MPTDDLTSAPKKRYLRTSPELGDGDVGAIYKLEECGDLGDYIAETVELEAGTTLTLTIVELTDEEFEALPCL